MRIACLAKTAAEAAIATNATEQEIHAALGELVYGRGEQELPHLIGKSCSQRLHVKSEQTGPSHQSDSDIQHEGNDLKQHDGAWFDLGMIAATFAQQASRALPRSSFWC